MIWILILTIVSWALIHSWKCCVKSWTWGEQLNTKTNPNPTHDPHAVRLITLSSCFFSHSCIFSAPTCPCPGAGPTFLLFGLHLASLSSKLCRSLLNETVWNIQTLSGEDVRVSPLYVLQSLQYQHFLIPLLTLTHSTRHETDIERIRRDLLRRKDFCLPAARSDWEYA